MGCPVGQTVIDPTTFWIDYACPHDVFHCGPVPIAQRLARYQEVDSEEEEVVPKLGPSSHRGSTGSHQSIRVTLKNQSMKCHRRTGSRAEAKRVSMLSKHTAFSSPMVSAGSVGLSCWAWGWGRPSFCSLPTLVFSDNQNSLFLVTQISPRLAVLHKQKQSGQSLYLPLYLSWNTSCAPVPWCLLLGGCQASHLKRWQRGSLVKWREQNTRTRWHVWKGRANYLPHKVLIRWAQSKFLFCRWLMCLWTTAIRLRNFYM